MAKRLPWTALHSSIEEQRSDRGVAPQCLAHPVREAKHILCDPQDSPDILPDKEPRSIRGDHPFLMMSADFNILGTSTGFTAS